jgi:hypothetical protein
MGAESVAATRARIETVQEQLYVDRREREDKTEFQTQQV